MPFQLIQNDIVKMNVDAIVNAANTELMRGGGVCGAIFEAAGIAELEAACRLIGACAVGDAVLTPGFNLRARYVIHTPGPIWNGGHAHESELLYNCYANALLLAESHHMESIAFPLISSGIYGFPKTEALKIATIAILDFLKTSDMDVYLVLMDSSALGFSMELKNDLEAYVEHHYVGKRSEPILDQSMEYSLDKESHGNRSETSKLSNIDVQKSRNKKKALQTTVFHANRQNQDLQSLLTNLDESFSQSLLRQIDESGMTDVETYKRANIDRKLFSKIRSDMHYKPSKMTALAFAIALKLNLEETQDLLSRAGLCLSKCSKCDVIIEYFIKTACYDIHHINQVLFYYDQPLLGTF